MQMIHFLKHIKPAIPVQSEEKTKAFADVEGMNCPVIQNDIKKISTHILFEKLKQIHSFYYYFFLIIHIRVFHLLRFCQIRLERLIWNVFGDCTCRIILIA